MNPTIIKAIKDQLVLSFLYKGKSRWTEPHTYGRQANRSDGLCAWQTLGGSGDGYRLFLVSEMQNIAVETSNFDGPRPDYHRGDRRFVQIYAEL